MSKGLGRLPIEDVRDQGYRMSTLRAEPTDEVLEIMERGWRYWFHRGWVGDQGNTPKCVAYAALHALEDGPVTLEDRSIGADPVMEPDPLYRLAQQFDQWPGEDYDGTSARGVAKALQREGLIREYRWAYTAMELVDAVLRHGPVLLGCVWLSGMDEPDADGFLQLTGHMRGGHEVLVNGVNKGAEKVRIKNSWGLSWGEQGQAWLHQEDLAWLLERAGGDACILVQ